MTAAVQSWCHLLTRGAQYFIRATLAGLWSADKYTRRCSLAGAKLSLSVILSRYRLRCSTLVVHKLESMAQQNSTSKNTQFKTDLTPFSSSLSVIFLFITHFNPLKFSGYCMCCLFSNSVLCILPRMYFWVLNASVNNKRIIALNKHNRLPFVAEGQFTDRERGIQLRIAFIITLGSFS